MSGTIAAPTNHSPDDRRHPGQVTGPLGGDSMPVLFAPFASEVEWFVELDLITRRVAATTDLVSHIEKISPARRIDNKR